MNFFEAMRAVDDGKKVCNGDKWRNDYFYHKVDGILCGASGKLADIEDSELKSTRWKIYEVPKPKQPPRNQLWESDDVGILEISLFDFNGKLGKREFYRKNFANISQFAAWMDALETFMRLKSHPLAARAGAETQYCIKYCPTDGLGAYEWHYLDDSKLGRVSAFFEKKQDIKQVIEDLGKDNLVKMFRTFHGIYE